MKERMLHVALEVKRRPEGVPHDECHRISEAERVTFCDALMIVSLVFKPHPSMMFLSIDGRMPEGRLSDSEMFRVWAYMAGLLSSDSHLSELQRMLCEFVWKCWNEEFTDSLPDEEPTEPQPAYLFFSVDVHPEGIPKAELERRAKENVCFGADAYIIAQVKYPYKGMYFDSVNGIANEPVHPQLWWASWAAMALYLLDQRTNPEKERALLWVTYKAIMERLPNEEPN